jgi:putative tryptophan/tyrosine transport system substrate-binding protein
MRTFATFSRERADAPLVPPDVTFDTYGRRIANLAITARLPTIFFTRRSAENGGLMSYGPNQLEELSPCRNLFVQDV